METLDLQPTLSGEHLVLKPLQADDYDRLFRVASDPLIWEQHPNNDRYQDEVFRQFFADALASGGAFVVIDRSDNEVIGSSRYHAYDRNKGTVEIGWTFLARSHWGGFYNAELKRLMLQHAFKSVQRVFFLVGPENYRSQRAMEKTGGVRVGIRGGRACPRQRHIRDYCGLFPAG